MMTPKQIRALARRSRAWVAAHANVSEPAARVYEEAGPGAVSARVRDALAPVYAKLASDLHLPPGGGAAA